MTALVTATVSAKPKFKPRSGVSSPVLHLEPVVARARGGDAAAFEQLYREQVGRIYYGWL